MKIIKIAARSFILSLLFISASYFILHYYFNIELRILFLIGALFLLELIIFYSIIFFSKKTRKEVSAELREIEKNPEQKITIVVNIDLEYVIGFVLSLVIVAVIFFLKK